MRITKAKSILMMILAALSIIFTGCLGEGNSINQSSGMEYPSSENSYSSISSVSAVSSEQTTTEQSQASSATYSSRTRSSVSTASKPRPVSSVPQKSSSTLTSSNTISNSENKRDQIGFGYYGLGFNNEFDVLEEMEDEAAKGHINTYLIGMAPYNFQNTLRLLKKVKDLDGMAWLSIPETVFLFYPSQDPRYGYDVRVINSWKEDLASMMKQIDELGLTDNVLGFYFDEPLLCGIKKPDFKAVTKQLRQFYPKLRVMSVFAVSAITPELWTTGHEPLDKDTAMYLTDAGYDMYHPVDSSSKINYIRLNDDLKRIIDRPEVRIWYVPSIMNYGGNKDEAYAITHLNTMMEFLMAEDNPGGMLCYAYHIPNHDGIGNIGFYDMKHREKNPWINLEGRINYVGKRILQMNH